MPRPAKRPAKRAPEKSPPRSASAARSTKPRKKEALGWKALNDRGSDRTIEGKLDGAISDFDAAIALAPKEVLPRYNRGLARFLRGDVLEAIDDFSKVIVMDPEFVPAYERRGAARQSLDALDGALADFDAALRLAPDNPDTLTERATVRALRSDFDGAVHDVERALSIAPKDWAMRSDADAMLCAMRKAKDAPPEHEHLAEALGAPADEEPEELATSAVEEALAEAECAFSREDNGRGEIDYVTPMDDDKFMEAVVIRLSEQLGRLVLYVLFRPKAKKEHRAELCEFVARANYGMGDGNFEMNLDDGSVRFKVALDYSGISLKAVLVRNMIIDAVSTIDVYEKALARVIAGKAKAKAALQAAERAAMQQGALQ